MIEDADYTGKHKHPIDPTVIEFVAYERVDGSWDVFVFEPQGSCPELDSARVDENHIFIKRIEDSEELEKVTVEIEAILGDEYKRSPYYRESGTRKIIQRIILYLKQHGASGIYVRSTSDDEWTLYIRNKDFDLAQEIVPSNL